MKTDNDRHWTKSWKEQLEGYSVAPPPEVWEELRGEIAPRQSIGKRWILWTAAACVALLVGTAIGLHYLSIEPIPAMTPLETNNSEPIQAQPVEPELDTQPVKNNENKLYAQVQAHTLPTPTTHEGSVDTKANATTTPVIDNPGNDSQTENSISGSDQPPHNKYQLLPPSPERDTPLDAPIHRKPVKSGNSSWSVAISLGNNWIAAADKRNGFGNFAPYSTLEMASIPSGENSNKQNVTPYQHIMLENINSQPTTDIKHHFPISAGITVQKSITRSLALETGLVYTYLASDLTAGGASYYTQKQELHYLGIPLKLNWNFWQKKYFNLYVAGGGMVEKCIDGKLSSHYQTDRKSALSQHESLHVAPLQWSLSAAAGISFKLASHIGLYIEPGIVYYFDDGADISTIRKEKPFNINLQAGVRFDF